MAEYGIEYLRKKLNSKRTRVLTRYSYYEEKHLPFLHSPTIPPALQEQYQSVMGWSNAAVDFLADRLVVDGFTGDDQFNLADIYAKNNADILFDSAILGALISSCDFIYISPGKDGFPRMQVIDGSNATGIIDPITGLMVEGYAVLSRDENGKAKQEAYFTPGRIVIQAGKDVQEIPVEPRLPYVTLVPIIHRPDAVRPFGRSHISRACMDIQDKAAATITRTEISAEFYSFPQKYVLGTSPDAEMDKWRATISSFLDISKDDDGDKPVVGQFQQQNVEPHISQLRMYAGIFGGLTGLTLDDLGFPGDNPSSADAIKACHETLRNKARKAQRNFSTGFVNAGYIAASIRDNVAYNRDAFSGVHVKWKPIIEPDASMLSAIGDGVGKINMAIPGYIDTATMQALTGIKGAV